MRGIAFGNHLYGRMAVASKPLNGDYAALCRELTNLGLAGFDEAEAASYALKRAVRNESSIDVDLQRLRDLSNGSACNSATKRSLLHQLFTCSDSLVLSFGLHGRQRDEQVC